MKTNDLSTIVENKGAELQYGQVTGKIQDNELKNSRRISYEDKNILDIIRSYPLEQRNYSSELGPEDFILTSEMGFYRDNRAYQK